VLTNNNNDKELDMEYKTEEQAKATKVRRPNYNAPDCGMDYSEDDALYERRCSDRSKPAPVDPDKKSG